MTKTQVKTKLIIILKWDPIEEVGVIITTALIVNYHNSEPQPNSVQVCSPKNIWIIFNKHLHGVLSELCNCHTQTWCKTVQCVGILRLDD